MGSRGLVSYEVAEHCQTGSRGTGGTRTVSIDWVHVLRMFFEAFKG